MQSKDNKLTSNRLKGPLLVTVICVTYNHEKYIKQALDGFLMQKTEFAFEVIVHDDCSTDNTGKILKDYEDRFHNVKVITPQNNQFSLGSLGFIESLYSNAKGKYIAHCEGDDYWTDVNKLQRQVDVLESNRDVSLCFHKVKVINEVSGKQSFYPQEDRQYEFQDLLRHNYIQSNSAVFRNIGKINIPDHITPLDWYLHILYSKGGRISYINKPMSVYRKNDRGVWWRTQKTEASFWVNNSKPHLHMIASVESLLSKKSDKKIIQETGGKLFSSICTALYNAGHINSVSDLARLFPQFVGSGFAHESAAISELQKNLRKEYKKTERQASQIHEVNKQMAAVYEANQKLQKTLDQPGVLIKRLAILGLKRLNRLFK